MRLDKLAKVAYKNKLVNRFIIGLLISTLISGIIPIGSTAYASERMVSREGLMDNIGEIMDFIISDNGTMTIAETNRIVQFDKDFRIIWESVIEGGMIRTLYETEDGSFLFTGANQQYNAIYGSISPDGSTLWTRDIEAYESSYVAALLPHDSSSYIVIGHVRETLGNSARPIIQLVTQHGDMIAEKLIPVGDSSESQMIYDALPEGNGDFVLFGNSQNNALVVKVSGLEESLGDIMWSQTYSVGNSSSFQRASKVSFSGTSGFVIGGNTLNPSQRATLTLIDEEGNMQWSKVYEQAGSGGIGLDVTETRDGGYVLVGGDNGSNGFFLKVDEQGNEQWRKVWPGTGNIRGIVQNSDGSYMMAGGVHSGEGVVRQMSVGEPTGLSVDSLSKRILGLNEKMEYSIDGGLHYEAYNSAQEPVFNGAVDVYVRYAKDLANGFEEGPPTVLSFTKQPIDLEEGQIFNQSGRSYSGVISSSPLGKDFEMTAYGDWPVDFTKDVQAFSGAVFDGEYIWMIPYRAGQVVRFHPETGQMIAYGGWPAGYAPGPDHFANGAFHSGVFDGESIWLIPYDANMVVQLDPLTGEMQGYDAWPDDVGESYKFSGGYFDGESIILVPHNSKVLVELNPATGEMEGYDSWPDDFQWGLNGAAFAASVFDGENVWMLPYEANQIVKFSTLTKEMTGYAEGPIGVNLSADRFIGGAYDGERIWMAPITTEYALAIHTLTGELEKYEIWPEGEQPTGSSYNSMFYDGEAVWLIPYNQNAFMRIDPHTGETTLHRNWPLDFNKGIASFYSSVSDGENLWAIPYYADQVIKLSPTTPPVVPTYVVAYDGNGAIEGDVPVDTERYEEGEEVTVLGNLGQLSLPDHRFAGWSFSQSVTDNVYTAGDRFTMGGEDVTLYAVWEESTPEQPATYLVRYDGNGATSGHVPVGERVYETGEQITIEFNSGGLIRNGYSFSGWNTRSDGSGTGYEPGDQLMIEDADITLYASWARLPSIPNNPPAPEESELIQQPETNSRAITIKLDSVELPLEALMYRVQGKNGQKIDELRLNHQLVQQLKLALSSKQANSIRFVIKEGHSKVDADEFLISLSPSALQELSRLDVQLEFDFYDIAQTLTHQQLTSLKQSAQAVQFRFVLPDQALRTEQAQSFIDAVESGSIVEKGEAERISMPIIVEATDAQGKSLANVETLLTFPLNHSSLPKDVSLQQAYLDSLFVYVVRDEGTSELVKGDIIQDNRHNVTGIQIKVNQFSTFAVVRVIADGVEELYEPYISGYADGSFQPSRSLTRAELAVILERLLAYDEFDDEGRENSFHDVKQGHWAAEAIQTISQAGIMEGIGKDSFIPSKEVTRAEFATVLARWRKLDAEAVSTFDDVRGHWAARAISQVQQQGWVQGYEDGTFRPHRALTRAEAVKVLNAVLGRTPMSAIDQPTWSDVSVSHWAWSDIESASQNYEVSRN
ncbi:S-layer homology domain-containing protein [Bacillus horti]|uniref:SLH domain-containing protein n=1 Tax=Caldalkalibacillus horti TaxID=77523 RepID=A0ABT9W2I4_9BACI|nr:S-layer homology domain-containing protein [Bacillus horti]MDQ0167282.1 hypothetical protein [Bacillus horti]